MKAIIKVFSSPHCPQCERVKKLLSEAGIEFEVFDISTPEGLSEMRIDNIWELEVPVISIDHHVKSHLRADTIKHLTDAEIISTVHGRIGIYEGK